jgi:DNA-binding beta-propeller fold protein YncE
VPPIPLKKIRVALACHKLDGRFSLPASVTGTLSRRSSWSPTCNGTVSSGCGTSRSRLLHTGNAPKWVAADQATDTVYVSNGDDGTASVLNGATCNATVASRCN